MEQISQYLHKFKNLLKNEYAVKEVVREAIFEVIGIEIDRTSISIRNGIAYIKATPSLKSEMTLRKTNVLERIKQKGLNTVKDIK